MAAEGIDLEAEYNNRARVPEHPVHIAGWQRDAAAYRAEARSELDLAYGPGERHRLDLFHPRPAMQAARSSCSSMAVTGRRSTNRFPVIWHAVPTSAA